MFGITFAGVNHQLAGHHVTREYIRDRLVAFFGEDNLERLVVAEEAHLDGTPHPYRDWETDRKSVV